MGPVGPGAVGVGWDGALMGLALHLSGAGSLEPQQAAAWMASGRWPPVLHVQQRALGPGQHRRWHPRRRGPGGRRAAPPPSIPAPSLRPKSSRPAANPASGWPGGERAPRHRPGRRGGSGRVRSPDPRPDPVADLRHPGHPVREVEFGSRRPCSTSASPPSANTSPCSPMPVTSHTAAPCATPGSGSGSASPIPGGPPTATTSPPCTESSGTRSTGAARSRRSLRPFLRPGCGVWMSAAGLMAHAGVQGP